MASQIGSNLQIDEVDIIIVGGGAAGSVIAGRLAKADPSLQILIIESGINNRDHPLVTTPGFFLAHQRPDTGTVDYYVSKPSEHVGGRSNIVATGKMLGGGSSVNFMIYNRASASDFDDWNTEGWTFKDLKPLLKKTETYHLKKGDDNHGYDGPLHVSYGGFTTKLNKEFLDVAEKHDGLRFSDDVNDFQTTNNSTLWPKWINPDTGKRSDAAHGFVHPILDTQTNLHVLVERKVVRILFEGNKAVGVEYIATNASADPTSKRIQARKMVVLTAGALSTPQILERSGIGSSELLSSLGVSTLSDLPGVGNNYTDHQIVIAATARVEGQSDDTGDAIIRGEPETMSRLMEEYQTTGKGALAWNFADGGAKLRPTSEEVRQMSPAFQEKWKQFFAEKLDKTLVFAGMFASFVGDPSVVPVGQYMTQVCILKYPFSRGYIHATSPTDVNAVPDFDAGFLSHEADVAPQVWTYKKIREIARRMTSFRGELESTHPRYAPNSAAACISAYDPDIVDIKYTEEDDMAIEKWVREKLETSWHSSGTAAMKPKGENGVVDKHLNVYGTQGLKVADLSIIPSIVGANTYSTALLIGEKAAQIISEELRI